MNRLFRQPVPGLSGYAALMLFAVAYLGTVALVIAPERLVSARSAAAIQTSDQTP